MSPVGTPIIAVSCHTVDGQGSHKAPGRTGDDKSIWKAECATNIITHMVHYREKTRARARASSQGQPATPTILIVGDMNITRAVMMRAMQNIDDGDVDEDCTLLAVNSGLLPTLK